MMDLGDSSKRPKLNIEYNETKDIVTIEGVQYSGDFFRCFANPPLATALTITKNDGIVSLEYYYDDDGQPI